MKRIKLNNFIFLRVFLPCIPVYAFLVIADIISFSPVLRKINYNMVAFHGVAANTDFDIIFTVAMLLCLCALPAVMFRFFYGSKSIYTLFEVQQSENTLFFSFFTSGIMTLLGLWLTQMISIFICYNKYAAKCSEYGSRMTANGLFEGIVEYDFFRMFFPFSVIEWLKLAFIIVSSVLAVIYIITVILSGKKKKLWAAAVWLITFFHYYNNYINDYISYFYEFLFFAAAIFTCIYFFKYGKKAMYERSIL